MSSCHHSCSVSSVYQTLDELDFEKGIWFAAQHNDISRVKNILNKNNDVNAEDKSGYTALHYASRNGHLELCSFLILKGANVNAQTKHGKVSALHRCASMGHLEIFKLLLNNGAAINKKDADGKTVLHRAVEGGHISLIKEILKVAPHLRNETDNKGKIPEEAANVSLKVLNIFKECK